eukprot:763733-Hanusia_phi.AAC.1
MERERDTIMTMLSSWFEIMTSCLERIDIFATRGLFVLLNILLPLPPLSSSSLLPLLLPLLPPPSPPSAPPSPPSPSPVSSSQFIFPKVPVPAPLEQRWTARP